MKSGWTRCGMVTLLGALLCNSVGPTLAAAFDDEFLAMESRLKSMGHGYHAKSEWVDVLQDLHDLAEQARAGGQDENLISVNLLQAMVAGDMLKDAAASREILEAVRAKYADRPYPVMRRVYVRLAEAYSRLGDEAAVARLISAFEKSPFYDPDVYLASGGQGPGDPVQLGRPSADSSDSVTVTAMETQERRARLGEGVVLPGFTATDIHGAPLSLADYLGRVVLVDFWVRGWYPWEQQLGYLAGTYERYHDQGFDIIGVCMDRDPSGLEGYLREKGIRWRQVAGDRKLPGQYDIYGEATSFLLDRNGIIIGRNLVGAERVEAIKSAL